MSPSFWQILIVLVVVLILFGPRRIPAIGRSLGEAIRGFRKGLGGKEEPLHPEPQEEVVVSSPQKVADKPSTKKL